MFSFNRNLRYPETGYNRLIDDFFSRTKMTVDLRLKKWDTNCNFHILDKYDKTKTQGSVTCIPLDFFRQLYKKDGITYDDEEIEKKELFKKFIKNNKYDLTDLNEIEYKDIQLSKFYKPYLLQSDLSKTVDYAKLDVLNNDLSKELGDTIGVYNKDLIARPRVAYRNEWMSNNDIKEFLNKVITKDDDIYFVDIIYIERRKTFFETSSSFYNSYFYEQLYNFKKSNKRFLVSMILYNSHFNAIVVDKQFKKKKKNGIIYLFDSQGYDKRSIYYNNNFFFLNSNMDQKKQKQNNLSTSYSENYHVDIITEFFKTEFNIELVILNKFVIQLLNSECGMFSMLFLYINILNKPTSITLALKNYLTMIFKGDLTVSQIRGLFFITNEDRSYESYMNSLECFYIKNRKFLEFLKLEKRKNKYIDIIFKKDVND